MSPLEFKRYEDNIAWLESTIDALHEENQELAESLYRHQQTLNEVMPLRRHIKRQIRHRLSQFDKKIRTRLARQQNFEPKSDESLNVQADRIDLLKQIVDYDRRNFLAYSQPAARPHILLPAYETARQTAVKVLRSIKQAKNHNNT